MAPKAMKGPKSMVRMKPKAKLNAQRKAAAKAAAMEAKAKAKAKGKSAGDRVDWRRWDDGGLEESGAGRGRREAPRGR